MRDSPITLSDGGFRILLEDRGTKVGKQRERQERGET